jgi:hypothetical protein
MHERMQRFSKNSRKTFYLVDAAPIKTPDWNTN